MPLSRSELQAAAPRLGSGHLRLESQSARGHSAFSGSDDVARVPSERAAPGAESVEGVLGSPPESGARKRGVSEPWPRRQEGWREKAVLRPPVLFPVCLLPHRLQRLRGQSAAPTVLGRDAAVQQRLRGGGAGDPRGDQDTENLATNTGGLI